MLTSVLSLLLFFVLLFSVTSTLLFTTAYDSVCVRPVTGDLEPSDNNEWGCGSRACPSPYVCQVGSTVAVMGMAVICTASLSAVPLIRHAVQIQQPQPPYALAGFSNTALSFLSMFQVKRMGTVKK